MKTTKLIPKTKVLLQLLVIPVLFTLFQACDTLESDPDIIDSRTEITGKEIYLRPNNPTFIDLSAKIQSNQAIKFAVTSATKNGQLSDLGGGILKYASLKGSASTRDAFEFTVYSLNNEVLEKDSIILIVDSDSTNLPCGVYPGSDYVYNINPGSGSILIDVTANDVICTNDTTLSIYRQSNSSAPHHGSAEVVGNKIKYTPSASAFESDSIMYKITSTSDPSILAYGVVYISTSGTCTWKPNTDSFVYADTVTFSYFPLSIFENDSICQNEFTAHITQAPQHGSVVINGNVAEYTPGGAHPAGFADNFYYELCVNGTCKSARVNFSIIDAPDCVPVAIRDSLELTVNDSLVYLLHVLDNDSVCANLTSYVIASQPLHGQATFDNYHRVIYRRDPTAGEGEDEFTYKICNSTSCSQATVLIHIE